MTQAGPRAAPGSGRAHEDAPGARAAYEAGYRVHRDRASRLERRERWLGAMRLGIAAAVAALVLGVVWAHFGPRAWAAIGISLVAFLVLVVIHSRTEREKNTALAAARFHSRGLARIDRAWDRLPASSQRFRANDHPFAADLDIFGVASVMQLVDATETSFGEERLAALLAADGPSHWPHESMARAEAARDLSTRLAFREALATAAGVVGDERPDPSALLRWAEGADGGPAALSAGLHALGFGAPAVVAILFVGQRLGYLAAGWLTIAIVGAMAIGLAVGTRLSPLLEAASARESLATRWRATLATVEAEPFAAPHLIALRAQLANGDRVASDELAALERIVGFVDARRNEIFRFFIGPLLMWDIHCSVALLRWRARAGRRLRGWLEVLGQIEALASLGAFAFEHPDYAWPEMAAEPVFEARALAHPLIASDRRVGNDVRLPSSGHALVVTGSNMSGKSTLLRAMGVNAVLASAGGPVCAKALRIGPLRVATSMRIDDSLSTGVSHFYAELKRLKSIVDLARASSREPAPGAAFFLLDEILHGTNSRERVLGAIAVVRELLALGALGAVSTHDLGITALERELGGRVENVHFEEQVERDTMTFDYTLRPGIVQSSNALRLMRAVGLAVEDA